MRPSTRFHLLATVNDDNDMLRGGKGIRSHMVCLVCSRETVELSLVIHNIYRILGSTHYKIHGFRVG